VLYAQYRNLQTDTKVIYRRYASLFFVTGIGQEDNELVTLEIIHRYVEILDRYFGNVRMSVMRSYAGMRVLTWSKNFPI
jgi:hypothetical protein